LPANETDADPLVIVNVPEVRRNWLYTSLQFNRVVTQSRMLTWWPGRLLVGYTRTMMAALRIGMIGLGGGSQAKFIHRCLPETRLEVVENNADVIALRDAFRIPDDDPRLSVIHGDGAQFVREHAGRYDILLVDAYDVTGIPAALSTQRHYDACRDALALGGVMASNLFCTDDRQAALHLRRIRRSFGMQRVLVVPEPKMRNQVVFAWVGDPLPPSPWPLKERTRHIPPRARRAQSPGLPHGTRLRYAHQRQLVHSRRTTSRV